MTWLRRLEIDLTKEDLSAYLLVTLTGGTAFIGSLLYFTT